MNWLQALKAWNAKKGGRYTIPKKGTKEYNEVRAMMGKELKGGMPKKKGKKERRLASDYKEEESEPETSESEGELSVYKAEKSIKKKTEEDEQRERLIHNIEVMEQQIQSFEVRIQNLLTMTQTPQRVAMIENYQSRIQTLERNIAQARTDLQDIAETESESEGSGLTGGILHRPAGIDTNAKINNEYNLALKEEIEKLKQAIAEEMQDLDDITESTELGIREKMRLREYTIQQYRAEELNARKVRMAEIVENLESSIQQMRKRYYAIRKKAITRIEEMKREIIHYEGELEIYKYIM